MESITELYCLIDDFYKVFEESWKPHVLMNGQRKRWRMTGISLPEMMTLVVLFHQLRHRQFKVFYLSYVHQHLRSEFPRLPSYTRIVALLPRCAAPMAALFETLKGCCTGLSIVDLAIVLRAALRRGAAATEIAASRRRMPP